MAAALPAKQERSSSGSAVMDGFTNLTVLRQIGLMIGLAASVAIGVGVVMWSQEPNYRPLYTELNALDAATISDILNQAKIKYQVDTNNGMLMVDSSKIHEARMKLAQAGLPAGNAVGYELLDKESAIGTSQFMENARYQRSLEGELGKTISNVSNVRAARVHLAIPKKSVFVGDERKPSASVLVDLYPGRELEKNQVAAIVQLVASSVPELDAKRVTVVDQKGNLLSEDQSDEDMALAARQFEYTRKMEDSYVKRINAILEPILGANRFKVQVSADVDFTRVEQSSENFNPDLPAVRSEQTLDEQRVGAAGNGGVPGALSNQPPVPGTAPQQATQGQGGATNQVAAAESSPSNTRKQSTKNYELDRTLSYTKHQVGNLKRLSVAVVVDDNVVADTASPAAGGEQQPAADAAAAPAADGQKSKRVRRTPEELEQISALVKDAVGYQMARGDSVNVTNQSFYSKEAANTELPPQNFWEQPWFWDILKQVLGGLFVLILVVGVLRPILKNLARMGEQDAMAVPALAGGELPGGGDLGGDTKVTLSGGDVSSLLPAPANSYEDQVTAIKGLIAEDPKRVAQVVKSWINAPQ
ncbi:MAG TPA: flagellar basal-body MS-ring/collar protein FliF [Pseudomonadales bacterium]|nr:flagellar basal-body MS-ring/collar protein FliF [Pseudomonadales bacterium]